MPTFVKNGGAYTKPLGMYVKRAGIYAAVAGAFIKLAGVYVPILDGYDYYVDSVLGSDANNGKSASSAFKTLAVAQAALIAKGNGATLGMARGSEWREQLSLNSISYWRIGAYGTTGEKPIIRGDDVIPAGGWSKSDGYTYVYQSPITLSATSTIYTNAWENDTWMVRVASVALCDSTPGSYYLSEASTSTTLYIHPSANDNPGSNGKKYEYTRREYGLLANASVGSTVDGIWTKRTLHQNGSLFVGNLSTVRNCRASQGSKHNLFVQEGSLVEDCLIDDAYYGTTQATLFVCYNASFTGLGVTIRRSACTMPAASTNIGGFLSHDSATTTWLGTAIVEDVTCTNLATAINLGRTTSQTINNPTITNCVTGINADVSLTVNGGSITTASGGQCVGISKPNVTVTLNGGTYNAPGVSANLIRSLSQANSTINLNAITVVRANGWMVQMTGAGGVLNSNGNTFTSVGFGHYDIAADTTVTSDNNKFGTVRTWRKAGTSYTSLAAWQAVSGQDISSTQI